ncbi:hypothetical protein IPdc08_01555 [archaeon]|nr:hypothetical protein IPdc08_01555 [archaeon]
MQKLLVEFQNTSGDAPQVPCSVSGVLNREDLSVSHTVLANNSSEDDLHPGKSGQDLKFPVIMQNQLIPNNDRDNEQVDIPAGLNRIKIYFSYTILKEVKRAIPSQIEIGGILAQT